jgi:hypothetical protein
MKQFSKIFLIMFAAFLLLHGTSFAQDGHYYTVTTWKISIPEGGSNAEFMGLMKEWYDKVVTKNDKIVSEKVLRHNSGSDMRDWVFVDEYASWNDIDAAGEVQNKLVEEGWTNKDERKKFFDTFWKYVDTHSDEILQELPELRK